jgi:hypothetical protein
VSDEQLNLEPEKVPVEMTEFCWVCRLCNKESQWVKHSGAEMPKGFVNNEVLGVICYNCYNREKRCLLK